VLGQFRRIFGSRDAFEAFFTGLKGGSDSGPSIDCIFVLAVDFRQHQALNLAIRFQCVERNSSMGKFVRGG
jgi:hypothetical protein